MAFKRMIMYGNSSFSLRKRIRRQFLKIFLGAALLVSIIPAIATRYYIYRGVSAFERNDFSTAEQYFIQSLLFQPTNPLAHAYLGDISYAAKNRETYFPNRVIAADPKINYREVIRRYETALEHGIMEKDEPHAAMVLTGLVMAYRAVEEQDKANQILTRVITQYPESFMPRYLLAADYFWRVNKPTEALALLQPFLGQKMLNISATHMQGIYALAARISLHFRNFADAELYAAESLELKNGAKNPNTELAHIVMAYVLSEKNQMDGALNELAAASAAFGNPHAYDCILARLYLRHQDYAAARAIANRRLSELETLRENRPYIGYGCLYALGWAAWHENEQMAAVNYFRGFRDAIAASPTIGATAYRDAAAIQEILRSFQDE